MLVVLPTRKPFSLSQSLAFISRFPACANEAVVTPDRVTVAFAVGGIAHVATLREHEGALVLEARVDAPLDELATRARELIGADDDLTAFYAAAAGDRPFAPIVRALHGLHHVRFIGGLAEIAVYSVLMQRASIDQAARLKRKFLDRFGLRVRHGDRTLRAMPELAVLAGLDGDDIAAAIGHTGKAERIVTVVRGVAALGEPFLRDAPYAEARDALLAIPGVGPFSAGAILLRGLGRMDELPLLGIVEREAREVYGPAWDPAAIARRYGSQIGYWSFYLKSGNARTKSPRVSTSSHRATSSSRASLGRAPGRPAGSG